MMFPEFLEWHYLQEEGRAVSLKSVIREFYESDTLACFDWPEHRIRKYLETKHYPVGTFNREDYIGNLSGDDSILVSDRDLVVNGGDLLPRDIAPDEFEFYARRTRYVNKRQVRTLTQNEMRVRGWNQRYLSRAQILNSMKPVD